MNSLLYCFKIDISVRCESSYLEHEVPCQKKKTQSSFHFQNGCKLNLVERVCCEFPNAYFLCILILA